MTLDHSAVIQDRRRCVLKGMYDLAVARGYQSVLQVPALRPCASRVRGRVLLTNTGSAQPSEIDPSGLIQAIARRQDREAFAALFDHFAPRVKTYLLRLRMAPNVAEEIAQETLLVVWRKANTFDPACASAGAWIFAIARNQRIDSLRRQKRDALEFDPSAEPDPPQQPDSVLISSERDSRVRSALKCLPTEQARVIELSFFDEASHASIAHSLDIPLGTVKSRVRLAMTRLREVLGDLI